jgi:DegV family protein with EDD domain
MSKVCILTDGTAQFPQAEFAGHELVKIIQPNQPTAQKSSRRASRSTSAAPETFQPTIEDFLKTYDLLGNEYGGVMVITQSSSLGEATRRAVEAATCYAGRSHVQVVDSQTTSVGLGLIVQEAARAAAAGSRLGEIERVVRAAIQRVYVMFFIPSLKYLAEAGYLSTSQAVVGEVLGLLPLYTLEEGALTPMGKARSQRHLQEAFQEFVEEFNEPVHIGLVKAASSTPFKLTPFRQYLSESFPDTPYSEQTITPYLAALLGPDCTGLVVMDSMD